MITKNILKELLNQQDGTQTEYYQDDNISYVIDYRKNKDTIEIKITKDNKKIDFENWLNTVDDDIFQKAYENFGEKYGLSFKDINDLYETSPEKIIEPFKNTVSDTVIKIINDLINKYNVSIGNCQSHK